MTVLTMGFLLSGSLCAQIAPGVYRAALETGEDAVLHYELKLSDTYAVVVEFETGPARFIKTYGGFYTQQDGVLRIDLEFNSDFPADGKKAYELPFSRGQGGLVVNFEATSGVVLEALAPLKQDLDGSWLFAARGPDTGQERRGEASSRKTLKYLQNGTFQWIAYDTADMGFHGTGGGSYTAEDGKYTEHIEYFSRDDSRVGATLSFDYVLKGNDWYHTGKSSKGDPMFEIWARR